MTRRPLPGLRSTADIVFISARVAVYVDGCFWHSCPEHATQPAANADWWAEKLAKNRERDRRTDATLRASGWSVVRIWEHETVTKAADRVEAAIRSHSPYIHS